MRLAFTGYGALGRQVARLIAADNTARPVIERVFFDDPLYASGADRVFPFDQFLDDRFAEFDHHVCLGYRHLKQKQEILGALRAAGRRLPPVVHPASFVDATATLGRSVTIYPGCNVDQNVVLRDGVLLHNSVIVSHDSIVGECCYLAPGVILAGRVQLGAGTFIGAGSVLINDIQIGAGSIVGAGSLVTRSLPAGTSAIGNPLRLLTRPIILR